MLNQDNEVFTFTFEDFVPKSEIKIERKIINIDFEEIKSMCDKGLTLGILVALVIMLEFSGILLLSIGYGTWVDRVAGYNLTSCKVVGYYNTSFSCARRCCDLNTGKCFICNDCYNYYLNLTYDGLSSCDTGSVRVGYGDPTTDRIYSYRDYPIGSTFQCYTSPIPSISPDNESIIIYRNDWYICLILGCICLPLGFILLLAIGVYLLVERRNKPVNI